MMKIRRMVIDKMPKEASLATVFDPNEHLKKGG
jgi:hypothetical protein